MKFSLVYPTQNRPSFIEAALRFLEHQEYDDFEVIVCDNYTDYSLSCEFIYKKSLLKNIKYIRPQKQLGMVANWNYALDYTSGEYIFYFTDKMFLLPGTLSYVADILKETQAEILSWVDNKFTPLQLPKYFDKGIYTISDSGIDVNKNFEFFDCRAELLKKVVAEASRGEQSSSHYARGKICFGAYNIALIKRIREYSGNLFHNICPDYTSMILGLSYANSALEISKPGIVHINTDLSNGGQTSVRDDLALSFLNSLGGGRGLFEQTLLPNLYSSVHNIVTHDYISLKQKFNLAYELNHINWLVYITEDLNLPNRKWSSPEIEINHRKLLEDFIDENLNDDQRKEYFSKIEKRRISRDALLTIQSQELSKIKSFRIFLQSYIPSYILNAYRHLRYNKKNKNEGPIQIQLYDLLR